MAKTGLYNVQIAYTQPNLPNVPSGFSQYSGGMNALARGVDNVGNTLSRIQQEYVQAQDASTFLKLETEFMQKTAELSAGLENHENPIRIPKDYEDGAKSILDGLIDSYGEKLSARGVDHIRNQLGFSIQRQVIQQTEFARQRLIDDAAVNFDAAYQAEMESRIKSGNFDIAAMEQWTKDTLDSLTVGVNTETEGRIPANIFSRDQSYWMVQKYNTKTASVMAKQAESAMRTALESHVAAVIAAEGFDAAEAMVSDPKNIQAMVDKYGLSIADVSALQSDMRGFVAAEKAKETQKERAEKEDFKKTNYKLETSGKPEDILTAIRNYESSDLLTVDEKRTEIKYLNGILDAMAKPVKFDPVVYDEARTRIQAVKFDNSKYDETRKWMMENVAGLGEQWNEQRNALDAALNATAESKGPHVQNAVDTVNEFFSAYMDTIPVDNLRDVFFKKQQIMNLIETKTVEMTPDESLTYTKSLLAPLQVEAAKSAWDKFWDPDTTGISNPISPSIWNISPPARIGYVALKDLQRRKEIINTEPLSLDDFTRTVAELKKTDKGLAKKYYDRWKDSF